MMMGRELYRAIYFVFFCKTGGRGNAEDFLSFRAAAKQFPRDYGKSRPCLNGFMGLCASPYCRTNNKEEYVNNINDAVAFLKGGSQAAVRDLTKQMQELSENLQFEEAAKLRDRIKAIKNLDERQKVVSINVPEEDVFALVNGKKKACF